MTRLTMWGTTLSLIIIVALTGCGQHKSGPPSLVGTWKSSIPVPNSDQTIEMTEIFNADGTTSQSLSADRIDVKIDYKYAAQDGVMSLVPIDGTMNGKSIANTMAKGAQIMKYTLTDDTLTLAQVGKKTVTLTRS